MLSWEHPSPFSRAVSHTIILIVTESAALSGCGKKYGIVQTSKPDLRGTCCLAATQSISGSSPSETYLVLSLQPTPDFVGNSPRDATCRGMCDPPVEKNPSLPGFSLEGLGPGCFTSSPGK
ncbi:hypothetical protein BDZ45DRAFT_130026 [Acephala macrosclerotiorum]|nr:hypothetical protein BDZ45DRAFT_130026 [Acephala macrosclerotiorum]